MSKFEARAPQIKGKLEAARSALADLNRGVAEAALAAAEDEPGAAERLGELRLKITDAERTAAEIERAHQLAQLLDREALARGAIAMRGEQLSAFKKHVTAREKHFAVALTHAAEMAKAFRHFLFESEGMVSVLPSGTAFPTLAVGELGLGGNLLSGCATLLLSEMFRVGASRDANGRVGILPFAKPLLVTQRGDPGKIPPALETLQAGHDALIREIEAQVKRLDEKLMRTASAPAKTEAAA
jgi:hypothetical protein